MKAPFSLQAGLLAAMVVCAASMSFGAQGPNARDATARVAPELARGAAVEHELKGGEHHFYRIPLGAGQFMLAVVEQRGINVVLTLVGPDGSHITTVDKSIVPHATEPLVHVAESSGEYRLEVRPFERDAASGRYEVRIREVREATTQDRRRAAAERISNEARQLSLQGQLSERFRTRAEKYEAALRLFRAAGDGQGEAETLEYLGVNSYRLNEPEKSRELLEQALRLRRSASDRVGEARIVHLLGASQLHAGDRHKALEDLTRALALYRAAGDTMGMAGVFHSFGWLYWFSEAYQQALESFREERALSQSMGYRAGESSALVGLGLVYWGLGEYQKSLEAYGQSLEYLRASGDRQRETSVLDNMGLVYRALGEYQKALECYAQSLPYRRTAGLRSLEADTLTGIGTVYAEMGEGQRALEHLHMALPIYREVGNRTGESYALRTIGFVHAALTEPDLAITYLNQALALDRALGERSSEARALAGLARAHRDRGDLIDARSQIESALDIIEGQRSGLASQDLRASFFASKRSYQEFYIDLLMRLDRQTPGAGHNAAALQASERARARSLLDLLAEARIDVSEGIDPALREKERAIQSRISRVNSQTIHALAERTPDKDRVAQLKEELKQADAEYEVLEAEIRRLHPRYTELRYPAPLTPGQIQNLLDEHTSLLEYALGQDGSYLFVVSRESLHSYRLPPAAVIDRLVADVRSALAQPGRREFGRFVSAARTLYDILVAPAAGALKEKQQLLIAPDGALHYLPFEALLTAASNTGRQSEPRELAYLLERWAVGYVPSASVLASLRHSRPAVEGQMAGAARKELVAFADPVYRQHEQNAQAQPTEPAQIVRSLLDEQGRLDLQPLKESRREVAGIAKFYEPGQTVVYLGREANEENVKANEHLRDARHVHFAAHGLISERAPQYSGLVLTLDENAGEDGLLQVHEVFRLKLSADLVVLSACGTALGKEVRGEGVIGLTRAFLYAGAASVAVSLWQVADESTADLMVRFYRQLNTTGDKADALRRAKLDMLRSTRHAHPYYWAPFILVGEPK